MKYSSRTNETKLALKSGTNVASVSAFIHGYYHYRVITWLSNYSYSITAFCNWVSDIGFLRHSRVNDAAIMASFLIVSTVLWKALLTFSFKKCSLKTSLPANLSDGV